MAHLFLTLAQTGPLPCTDEHYGDHQDDEIVRQKVVPLQSVPIVSHTIL